MSSFLLESSAEAESVFAQLAAERPTPEQIDGIAEQYLKMKASAADMRAHVEMLEQQLVDLVQRWGTVPPYAEKSRRLAGNLAELTVTKSDVLTINDERVETLREALEANGHGEYFAKLFTLRSKYEIVEGAESALKSESLPKRLAEKVLNLFGRCIAVKAKKPSLRVSVAKPSPAKRQRKTASKERTAE